MSNESSPGVASAALVVHDCGRRCFIMMLTRRDFLQAAGTGIVGSSLLSAASAQEPVRKKMAIVTTVWRNKSHAWHIGERFLAGYPVEGRWHRPPLDVVAAYVDQQPAGDLSRQRSA